MLIGMLLDSLRLFKSHYIGMAKFFLPIYIPLEIFNGLYSSYFLVETSGFFARIIPGLIGLLALPVFGGAVIFYLASIIADNPIDTPTAWRLGIKYWVPMFLLIIYVSIIVSAGFLLLIIPGFILMGLYAFSAFHLLLNNRSPLDAMRDSWHTSKKYLWKILGGYLVITVVLDVPYHSLVAVLEQYGLGQGLLYIAFTAVYSFLSLMYLIFTFRVYHYAKDQQNSTQNSRP